VEAVAQGVKQLHSSSDRRERHIGAAASSGSDLGSSGTVGCGTSASGSGSGSGSGRGSGSSRHQQER